MTSADNEKKFLQHRIASATGKFSSLKKLLTDRRIGIQLRLRYLNSFVRSRLTYSAATWNLTESQIQELESVWCRFIRRMVPGGFRRGLDLHMLYTNEEIYRRAGMKPLRSYLRKQQLRWVGHVCRMENSRFQKRLLFAEQGKYQRDLWTRLEKISSMDRVQLRKLMMQRNDFFSWLNTFF